MGHKSTDIISLNLSEESNYCQFEIACRMICLVRVELYNFVYYCKKSESSFLVCIKKYLGFSGADSIEVELNLPWLCRRVLFALIIGSRYSTSHYCYLARQTTNCRLEADKISEVMFCWWLRMNITRSCLPPDVLLSTSLEVVLCYFQPHWRLCSLSGYFWHKQRNNVHLLLINLSLMSIANILWTIVQSCSSSFAELLESDFSSWTLHFFKMNLCNV